MTTKLAWNPGKVLGLLDHNSRIWSRMRNLRNGSRYPKWKDVWSTAIPPAFHKKSGELWSTKSRGYYILTHPNGLFRETIFRPLRGCCPLKFLHTLASVHPNADRGSPKNFNRENLKYGLKFNVWARITSVLIRESSRNFSRPRAARQGW